MRWRSDTVITFQIMIASPPAKKPTPRTTGWELRAGMPTSNELPAAVSHRDRARPSRRSTLSVTREPTRLPTATVVSNTP